MNYANKMNNASPHLYAENGPKVGENSAKQAEIPHQMERLERTLKGCLQGLEQLGARLEDCVMRSEPPSATGNNIAVAAPVTPYAARLHDLVSIAAMVNERIQSISVRLEV